jgi:hypothetical protein
MLPIGVWATNHAEGAKERGERGDMVVIVRREPPSLGSWLPQENGARKGEKLCLTCMLSGIASG